MTVSVFEPGATTANPARTLTGLTGAFGVAIDATDHVYVSNFLGVATTVSVFDPGSTTPNPAKTLTGLNVPTAVAFDSTHHVYVTNFASGAGNTVSVFEPGATTANPARRLTGLHTPVGVAVGVGDRAYVSNFGSGPVGTTVSVFDPPVAKPGQPGKPTVKPKAHGKAKITWVAAAANGEAPAYLLQVSRPGKGWKTITTTMLTKYVGPIPKAKHGRTLWFRVIARNSAGDGPTSEVRAAVMK
jgi:hypothetical protein